MCILPNDVDHEAWETVDDRNRSPRSAASSTSLISMSTNDNPDNPVQPDGTSTLEQDIARLNTLLASSSEGDNVTEQDEANLAEILERLEKAEGLARGMESQLDDTIDKLDSLLSSLENTPEKVQPAEDNVQASEQAQQREAN